MRPTAGRIPDGGSDPRGPHIARQAMVFATRARFARPALVNGAAGIVVFDEGGRPFLAMAQGLDEGLTRIDRLSTSCDLRGYRLFPAARRASSAPWSLGRRGGVVWQGHRADDEPRRESLSPSPHDVPRVASFLVRPAFASISIEPPAEPPGKNFTAMSIP